MTPCAGEATQRIMFLYWGRRGPLSRIALELGLASRSIPGIATTISVSRQNEIFDAFATLGDQLFPVSTFSAGRGALSVRQLILLRQDLAKRIEKDRITTVVCLMPHVWSQLVIDIVRRAGARFVTVLHDAVPHPGDGTSFVHAWLLRELSKADRIVTLSRTVRGELLRRRPDLADRVSTLFLPDIASDRLPARVEPGTTEPLRVLFFGRIMSYKGLDTLTSAAELLARRGVAFRLSIVGEGRLGANRARLEKLGADVRNVWLPESEIPALLARHDVVALAHSEASQSGVAALAFGAGVPVVACPIGGIVEQVETGRTGILAAEASASALADAIEKLAADRALLAQMRESIEATRDARSIDTFLRSLLTVTRSDSRPRPAAGPLRRVGT